VTELWCPGGELSLSPPAARGWNNVELNDEVNEATELDELDELDEVDHGVNEQDEEQEEDQEEERDERDTSPSPSKGVPTSSCPEVGMYKLLYRLKAPDFNP
jgi:hypothetical protein